MYTEARLGQLWQVLTPLLNAGVYYLIFGLLLNANRGVPDYISFLVTGVFVFNFTQRAFITSSQVIRETLPLIRALYFPRACLPLGYVLIELQQLVLSFAVLFVIVVHRRRAGHPVLAVHHPGADPAEHLQRGLRVHPGPLGRQHRRRQPVAAVHRADLDVHLGRDLQPADADADVRGQAAPTTRGSPTCCRSTRPRSTSRWSDGRCWRSTAHALPGAQPYNHAKCVLYRTFSGNPKYASYSAYCHPSTLPSIPSLWVWGAAWAVVVIVVGFLFFWRAEARYGRG